MFSTPKLLVIVLATLATHSVAALAGAFSVVVSESPMLVLEGIAIPQGDGTAEVQVAWVLDSSPAGISMLPIRTQLGEPHVQIDLYMVADIDPVTGVVYSYSKYGIIDVLNINFPDSPIPNGLSLLASVAPGATGGWAWSNILWTTEDEITDSIAGIGGGPTSNSIPQPCEYIPELDEEIRQFIELGNGLWLLIVVRNGEVYMMVYEYDPVNGCWRFGFAPQNPGGPGGGWWGTPPNHTLVDSLNMVFAQWIRQLVNGQVIGIPGDPVDWPG